MSEGSARMKRHSQVEKFLNDMSVEVENCYKNQYQFDVAYYKGYVEALRDFNLISPKKYIEMQEIVKGGMEVNCSQVNHQWRKERR